MSDVGVDLCKDAYMFYTTCINDVGIVTCLLVCAFVVRMAGTGFRVQRSA